MESRELFDLKMIKILFIYQKLINYQYLKTLKNIKFQKWELNKGKQYPHIYYPYLIKIINVFDLEEIINRKDFNYLKK